MQALAPVQAIGNSGVVHVIHVTMLVTPQPIIYELEMAFHNGADSHKQRTEMVMFSVGAAQWADNAHMGISPLAFGMMTVAEEVFDFFLDL